MLGRTVLGAGVIQAVLLEILVSGLSAGITVLQFLLGDERALLELVAAFLEIVPQFFGAGSAVEVHP